MTRGIAQEALAIQSSLSLGKTIPASALSVTVLHFPRANNIFFACFIYFYALFIQMQLALNVLEARGSLLRP